MTTQGATIEDVANVARAVFSPQMVNATGIITRAAFSLRHNEGYISVCQMSVDSWLDDIKSIPLSDKRKLDGYAILNVGEIRSQGFILSEHQVALDVLDKSTAKNRSHAGIILSIDGLSLRMEVWTYGTTDSRIHGENQGCKKGTWQTTTSLFCINGEARRAEARREGNE